MEEPSGVSEVREWRRKVQEGWQGKSWEEIQRELNEAGDRFRAELAEKCARPQPDGRQAQTADVPEPNVTTD